jgi:hypothetical protein
MTVPSHPLCTRLMNPIHSISQSTWIKWVFLFLFLPPISSHTVELTFTYRLRLRFILILLLKWYNRCLSSSVLDMSWLSILMVIVSLRFLFDSHIIGNVLLSTQNYRSRCDWQEAVVGVLERTRGEGIKPPIFKHQASITWLPWYSTRLSMYKYSLRVWLKVITPSWLAGFGSVKPGLYLWHRMMKIDL